MFEEWSEGPEAGGPGSVMKTTGTVRASGAAQHASTPGVNPTLHMGLDKKT